MAEEKVQFQATPVPKFDGDYDHWSMVMKTLIQSKECWNVVTDGYTEIRSGEQATPTQRKNYEENKLKDLKVLNYLFQSIDKSILKTITMKETSKQVWDAMKIKYQGSARVKRAQLQRLRRSFEVLEMKTGECVIDYLGRVMVIANEMRACGDDMTDVKIVEKVLRTLTENFNYIVCTIEETKNLDELSVDELQSSLLCHEQKLLKKSAEEQVLKVEQETSYGRGRGRGRSSSRGRGRGRGRGGFDKSVVECYRCHKLGHFQYECPTEEKAVNYAEFDENEELLLMATVDIERYQREEEVLMAESETLREGKERIWFLDSACSNHMTGNKLWFTKLDMSFTHSVKLGNDKKMEIKGIGDVKIRVNGVTQIITKVYYAPDLTSNLISVGQLQDKGVTFIFKNGCCKVYHPIKGLILSSKMTKNRMFPIFVEPNDSESCMQVITGEDLWHRRFAHVSHKALRTMQFNGMVEGLPKVAEKTQVCEVCAIGKQNRVEIPKKSKWHASEKLQLVHTDICGPITPKSMSSKRYVLVFIDDFSRKTWVYCLATKGEAFEYFKKFKALVENETGHYVKCLRSDRGGEFTSQEFNIFCEKEGIQRQLTAAYTPQQNGVAERRNRTLINMVRCLLAEKEMPKHFWAEAVVWACHVLNRCISSDKMICDTFKESMKREFDMTDLGKMKYFLGVEISQTEEAIEVSQEKYAKEVVKRFGMEEANPVHVPMVPGAVLTKLGSGEEVDETLYKSLVGSLMYLTVSRPDIMYVVSLISRFMAKPREDHFLAAKRVLRYIRGTYKFGLRYVKGKKDDLVVFADSSYARDFKGKMDDLVVFTDSNYARDGEDRRSTSGYVCLLSGAAVCWCSRKQEIVTLSSTEAEYVAAGLCACHCVWMKGLLEEMEENTGTVTIFCDNTSTIKLSKNPVMHRRTKHIDVRYHYLRELVEKQVVELEFCGTKQQLADGMTKPVKEVTFNEIRTAMGVCEVKQDA
ncbi:putative RNA-directed DNA polymerase [Helianthus annuus]|nr:putative RNA-directed DNA polymerase [Helianthus annuus]